MSTIESVLRQAALAISGRQGALLLMADGPDRPDLVLIDQRAGPYAIEFEPNGVGPEDRSPFVRLNRKRSELRETLGHLGNREIGAAVVLGAAEGRLLGTPAAANRPALRTRVKIM